MIKKPTFSLLILGALLTGCSEESMLEKCIAKEEPSIKHLSQNKVVELAHNGAAPYYMPGLKPIFQQHVKEVEKSSLAYLNAKYESFKSSPGYKEKLEEIKNIQNKPEVAQAISQLDKFLSATVSMDSFSQQLKDCTNDAACKASMEIWSQKRLELDASHSDLIKRYVKEYSDLTKDLEQLLRREKQDMSYAQFLDFLEVAGLKEKVERLNAGLPKKEEIEEPTKELWEATDVAFSNWILPGPIMLFSDKEFEEQISYYRDGGFAEEVYSRVAPFTEKPTDKELAVQVCNENGVY